MAQGRNPLVLDYYASQALPGFGRSITEGVSSFRDEQDRQRRIAREEELLGRDRELRALREQALGIGAPGMVAEQVPGGEALGAPPPAMPGTEFVDQEIRSAVDAAIDPMMVQKDRENLVMAGVDTPEKQVEIQEFNEKIQSLPDDQLQGAVQERMESIVARGGDARDTAELMGKSPEEIRRGVDMASMIVDREAVRQMYAIDPQATRDFLGPELTGAGAPNANVQSKFITDEGTIGLVMRDGEVRDTGKKVSRNLQLTAEGFAYDPTQGKLTKIGEPGRDLSTEDIIRERQAERKRMAEDETRKIRKIDTEKASRSAAKSAFDQIPKINTSINNIDEAITALDEGAKTGVITKYLPSIRQSTQRLDAAARRMGLDVVGSVTFGALSEKELAMAMNTAVPKDLNEEQLRTWLVERKTAQEKLRNELEDAAIFLEGGGSPAQWLKMSRAKRGEAEATEGMDDIDAQIAALEAELGGAIE